jgi:membrane protease YdiL (CAAX protease family)
MLVLLLSFVVTVVCFILWLCQKPPARDSYGNVLIVAATICAVAGLVSLPVTDYVAGRHEIPNLKQPLKPLSAVTKADMAGNVIEKAQAFSTLKDRYPALGACLNYLGYRDASHAQDSLETFFNDLTQSEKEQYEIITRRAILEHAKGKAFVEPLRKLEGDLCGGDVEKALRVFMEKHHDEAVNDNIRTRLARLRPQQSGATAEQLAFVRLILTIDQARPAERLGSDVKLLEKELPEGWYRYSLLTSIYKSAAATTELEALTAAHNDKLSARVTRLLTGYLLELSFIIGGIVAIVAYFKKAKTMAATGALDNPLVDCSIKRIYCQALVIYYAQFLIGLPIGLLTSLFPALLAIAKEWTTLVTALTLIANLVLLLITTDLMLCKHTGVTLPDVLSRLMRGKPAVVSAWGAGAFCILRSVNTLYLILVVLIFQHAPTSNNDINHQILGLAINANALNFLLLWIVVAIVAPFAEELAFRGILYSVLRKRVGVTWASVASAIIFACYHLDPSQFPTHFVMGVGLAFVYEKTRSLSACFITHMLWNTSVILLAWLIA